MVSQVLYIHSGTYKSLTFLTVEVIIAGIRSS